MTQHSRWNTKGNRNLTYFKSLRPEGLRLELIITCMSSTSSSPSGLGLVTSSATSFAASSNYATKGKIIGSHHFEQFQFSVSLWYNFSQNLFKTGQIQILDGSKQHDCLLKAVFRLAICWVSLPNSHRNWQHPRCPLPASTALSCNVSSVHLCKNK